MRRWLWWSSPEVPAAAPVAISPPGDAELRAIPVLTLDIARQRLRDFDAISPMSSDPYSQHCTEVRSRLVARIAILQEAEQPTRVADAREFDLRVDASTFPVADVMRAEADAVEADHSYSASDFDADDLETVRRHIARAASEGRKWCRVRLPHFPSRRTEVLRSILIRKGYRCKVHPCVVDVWWDRVDASAAKDLSAMRESIARLEERVTSMWFAPGMPGALTARDSFAESLADLTARSDE